MAVAALAESLDRMGLDVAEPVVERARTELVRVPSVAQLYEVAREIRKEIDEREHPALSPGEFLSAMPPEVRERVDRMHERWGAEPERDVVAEDVEWQHVKATTLAMLRMEGTCLGTDKPPVQIDGMLVCPVCRVEVVWT
jgi:hypothetical protein